MIWADSGTLFDPRVVFTDLPPISCSELPPQFEDAESMDSEKNSIFVVVDSVRRSSPLRTSKKKSLSLVVDSGMPPLEICRPRL